MSNPASPSPVQPVTEDDLHAFIDGQLPPVRRETVLRHLDANPAAAAKVAAYGAQRAALRAALLDRSGAAPPAPRLSLASLAGETIRRQRRRGFWRIAASALVAAMLGAGGGYYAATSTTPSRQERAVALLGEQAAATFVVFAVDTQHPVDVGPADLPRLRQWLSARLDRPVDPPPLDMLGYRLIGARLVATEHGGAAALILYENEGGDRIGLLLRPMAPDLRATLQPLVTPKVGGKTWIDQGMGYALIGPRPGPALDRAVEQVMNRTGTSG